MKTPLSSILFLAGISITNWAQAQAPASLSVAIPTVSPISKLPSMDVYGAIPIHDCGWGGGLNLLSSPVKLFELDPKTPVEVRFGGEFYYAELNHRRLGIVPLAAPQNGDARVRLSEGAFGLNAMTRFSLNYSKRFTPYVDVFGGLRGFTANMNITPVKRQNGYEESTSKNLSSTAHWNYGMTLGFLVSINDWVKFNAGLMYTRSDEKGELVNIKSAVVNSGIINAGKKLTANDLVIAKIGFTFMIDGIWSGSSGCNSCGCNGFSPGFGGGGGGLSNSVNFNFLPMK